MSSLRTQESFLKEVVCRLIPSRLVKNVISLSLFPLLSF